MSANETQKVLLLNNVRFSYLYAFKPFVGRNDKGQETKSYTCHAIMTADHPDLAKVKQAQREVAAAAWGDQAQAVLTQLAAQDKLCLHNGDISKMGVDGYQGMFYVSANSKVRPTIVETRGGVNVPLNEEDGRPYSGCYGNIMVAIYAQGANGKPSQFGKRINAQLMGVQFVRHGEAFGGGKVARPDEFGIVATDADSSVPMAAAASDSSGLL